MKLALWAALLMLAAFQVRLPLLRADDPHSKPAAGEKQSDEPVYTLGDGIEPPRITRQVNPDYSRIRGVRVKGSVTISVIISSQGVPHDAQVVRSLHPDVDRCAVEAVTKWRFSPARKEGKAVAVKVTIDLEFRSM